MTFVAVVQLQLGVSALLYHQTDWYGLIEGAFTPRMTTDPEFIEYAYDSTIDFDVYKPYVELGIASWNSTEYEIAITKAASYSESICDIGGYNGNSSYFEDYADAYGYTLVYCGEGAYTGNNTVMIVVI